MPKLRKLDTIEEEDENDDESEDNEENEVFEPLPADREILIEKDIEAEIAPIKALYYYCGMRFKDVMTTNNEGHNYSVKTSKIAGYNVLTRAEIDCSFNNEHVELKVGLDPRSKYKHCKFRKHKLHEIWLQSYYGGIEKVVYGMRSYVGFISRFFTYFVDEIPDLCNQEWNAVEMTYFVEDVFGCAIRNTKEGFRTRVEYDGEDFIELKQTEYPEDVLPPWLEGLPGLMAK